ncbi:ATP-dependent DNA helicase [Hespellia stercorisuis]|uniref:ATP-dependent DNA helicase DinG n=1 Tax=Hespellia stercorisuis DSM 15480 TaxID=1121950 RepID=A0A1M6I9T0_9FIRM|nr:ATP-dependent DNA helicase [Hespellia stercorisuis]SHJ31181.1 ATP-dependent DNA helicase DinG [Hespellia stercorisuis DSM 15480]
MFYRKEYEKKAHREIDCVFRELLPQHGLCVREAQIRLSHQMLDTLLGNKIALCDAGVGIGKTYAYLTACLIMKKYAAAIGRFSPYDHRPMTISTSSIALQKAILQEYLPFLSKILLEAGIIQQPIQAVLRKGKEHFVCDSRLEFRLQAIAHKEKNAQQKDAVLKLKETYDMDSIHGLSSFDRRQVCVPKFCPSDCPGRKDCRYQNYLKRAMGSDICFQICNHNYLLADAVHRSKDYKALLSDYRALVVDESHKLPEAARQMYGKSLCVSDIEEIARNLDKEFQRKAAKRLRESCHAFLDTFKNETIDEKIKKRKPEEPPTLLSGQQREALSNFLTQLGKIQGELAGDSPRWVQNRLEEAGQVLAAFFAQDKYYILYVERDKDQYPIFCAISRTIPKRLKETLWEQGFPAILTSGTLKAGNGFERTRQVTGLLEEARVQEYVAESPFHYKENCLLYLPKTLKPMKKDSPLEVKMIAEHIKRLIQATYGHTLVLFTSYALMGNVRRQLQEDLPFPFLEVWRHSQEEIHRFKTLKNAVLFSAGSCWEGVDFPGDIVSSLILVKLPFAVPDPVGEAEKEQYGHLEEYIREIIVPDMQKKLRQGFGRAIRTEQDTCVVSILDYRALPGGRYHQDVLCALPSCQMAGSLEEVERFIRSRKGTEYYM